MKIVVEQIPAAGRQVTFDKTVEWAVEAAKLSLDRPPSALSGSFELKRAQNGVVIVDLRATSSAQATCDRCGEECSLDLAIETRLLYAPEEKGGADYDGLTLSETSAGKKQKKERKKDSVGDDEEGIELDEQDLDVGWYRRGEIDLGDVLSEALALAAPPRIVCADIAECDRRTSALLSTATATDSGPFAALAALKRKTGKG